MKRAWLAIGFMGISAVMAEAAAGLTYVDLLHKLTDLEGLALLPSPGVRPYASGRAMTVRASTTRRPGNTWIGGPTATPMASFARKAASPSLRRWTAPAALAHLVRGARQRSRQDLPGRLSRAGGRSALQRLLRPEEPTLHIRPARAHGVCAGRTVTCRFPIRNPARSSPKRAGERSIISAIRPTPGVLSCRRSNGNCRRRKPGPWERQASSWPTGWVQIRPASRPGQTTDVKRLTVPANGRVAVAGLEGAGAISGLRVKADSAAIKDVARCGARWCYRSAGMARSAERAGAAG